MYTYSVSVKTVICCKVARSSNLNHQKVEMLRLLISPFRAHDTYKPHKKAIIEAVLWAFTTEISAAIDGSVAIDLDHKMERSPTSSNQTAKELMIDFLRAASQSATTCGNKEKPTEIVRRRRNATCEKDHLEGDGLLYILSKYSKFMQLQQLAYGNEYWQCTIHPFQLLKNYPMDVRRGRSRSF